MRNCCDVIREMISKVPEDKTNLLIRLNKNLKDASYKAPEETVQWFQVQDTLIEFMEKPTEDWEFEVLSVFTTKSVSELREIVLNK